MEKVPEAAMATGDALSSGTAASSTAGGHASGNSWDQGERWGALETHARVEEVSSEGGATTSGQHFEDPASGGCAQHRYEMAGGMEPYDSLADVTIDEDTDSGASLFCTAPVLTPPPSSAAFSSDAQGDDEM